MDKKFIKYFKNKKILITGHTGFKGTWLCLWLTLMGAKVAGFSNKQKTVPSLFDLLRLKKKIKSFEGDISNFTKIKESIKKSQFHLETSQQNNSNFC